MGKKMALLITVGLTVFVLGAGAVIAANVYRAQIPSAGVTTDATVETLLARDAQYRARLEEANRVIQEANATVATLQAQQSTLQTQNETLVKREALYQQEIAKANALLQQQAVAPQVIVAAPQGSVSASAPAAPARGEEHRDESDNEKEHDGDD